MKSSEVREQCKEFLIKELNINPLLPMYDGYIDACVKYASQFREPSTQGEKDAYSAGLMCERILAKDEIERLKQENERLKECFGNLLASFEQYGEIPYNVMTKAKQALNPKD